MNSKERMKLALTNCIPDRVPVAPDISNMIPCRLTGKPYWDIYIKNDPPLWKAYIDAVKYFDMDGWFTYSGLDYIMKTPLDSKTEIIKEDGRWLARRIICTPDGELSETIVCPVSDPPSLTEKIIKNFKEDFNKIKYLFEEPVGYRKDSLNDQNKAFGDLGLFAVGIFPPGMHIYLNYFNGNLEAATYAYYDYPELFEELVMLHSRQVIKMTEMAIDAGVESVLTGGSGSITLQSPDIWNKISLPALKQITQMCSQAGIITGIHSCGLSKHLLSICAEETEINYVNPLEVPPMGDITLSEARQIASDKIALMGNLHTTDVMLYGTPDDVKLESLKAIMDAGENGGFVLSTGDQCGRDTPDINIFTMVKTAKDFGTYPLDTDRIRCEIDRLTLKKHGMR